MHWSPVQGLLCSSAMLLKWPHRVHRFNRINLYELIGNKQPWSAVNERVAHWTLSPRDSQCSNGLQLQPPTTECSQLVIMSCFLIASGRHFIKMAAFQLHLPREFFSPPHHCNATKSSNDLWPTEWEARNVCPIKKGGDTWMQKVQSRLLSGDRVNCRARAQE